MNRVTPETPLEDVLSLLANDGYVLMENALTPAQVAEISTAYDEQLALHPRAEGALRTEVPCIIQKDERFEQLMDNAPVFRVLHANLGDDIELSSGGELDHKYGHTPAYIGWHNDFVWMTNVPYPRQNYWLRATYFIGDVTENGGPFTLLPGSHTKDHACPAFNGPDGQPQQQEGQIGITGPAGSCLINNTEIWHTNSPNESDEARRLIMLCYKHSWMKQWLDGYEITPDFMERQTDPIRRQLCGGYSWHNYATHFPAHNLRTG